MALDLDLSRIRKTNPIIALKDSDASRKAWQSRERGGGNLVQHNKKKVPVLDAKGKEVGEVSTASTSIGASKLTGVSMMWGKTADGRRAWVPSTRKAEQPERIAVIKRADSELQIAYGEVYAPNLPDSEHDFMTAEDIVSMAHGFMRAGRHKMCDVQHDNEVIEDACIVESFIARKGDTDFIEGAWVIGMHIPDKKVWKRVKDGELNGFSMEALVRRIPVEIEMEVPPVITGHTMKNEKGAQHEHTFYVSYDEDGRFRGGRTDVVDGHFHEIRGGSFTEKAEDHTHRFSHLDGIVP